ncbi:hypothetical protein D3C87_2160570 [compost metagenome]
MGIARGRGAIQHRQSVEHVALGDPEEIEVVGRDGGAHAPGGDAVAVIDIDDEGH